MRLHRRSMVTALAVGLVTGGGGLAWAGPVGGATAGAPVPQQPAVVAEAAAEPADGPPPGWTVAPLATGVRLTWRPTRPVPMGDAAVQFFAGDRPLGTPRPPADGTTFVLDVARAAVPDLAGLRVVAAGRRLDGTPPTATPRIGPPVVPAVLPAAEVDPGTPGPYETVTGEYVLPALRLPGLPAPVGRGGVGVSPRGAPGARPLVLFLHGRHEVCHGGTRPDQTWPCPAGTRPVPSHRGYLTAQRLLASQGYLTVSVAANGINGQDGAASDGGSQARSSLVRSHLGSWADWAGAGRADAPTIVRDAPPPDLDRVLLVGHSRGGEGVNRAVLDSLAPPPAARDGYQGTVRWQVRGTYLLAPTAFGQNPAADVPSLVVLPGCDGDVADLQGQVYVDGTRGVSRGEALHSAAYVVGANHNYFNSEWTPGQATAPAQDDWPVADDAVCGTGPGSQRLTPVEQQAVGATYAAAAARLFVQGDDQVRQLLDGTAVRAPSADPARVRSHAVGAARTPLLTPAPDLTATAAGGSRVRVCDQVAPLGSADSCQVPGPDFFRSPHDVGFFGLVQEPDRHAVLLDWTAAGGTVALQPAAPAVLTGAQAVALRIAVPPNSAGSTLDVAVVDGAGRRAALGTVTLAGLPGTVGMPAQWAQEARVPLTAATAAGLDLGRVVRVELTPHGAATGRAWLIDAWGWRAGTPAAQAAALPRIDVEGLVDVREGDSGVRTYQLPVAVSGSGTGQLRLFVVIPATGAVTHKVVTVSGGTGRFTVPIEVAGNTRYGFERMQYLVLAKTVQDTVVGGYEGQLGVLNDDPRPAATATPVADRVTEGTALSWRIDLSAAADVALTGAVAALAPASGAELSTADVPAEWLQGIGVDPAPSRALSAAGGQLRVLVDAGARTALLQIPTVADGLAEPSEAVRLSLDWAGQRVELTGVVSDAP